VSPQRGENERIFIHKQPRWDGKLEMVNVATAAIRDECLLWEVDADELWLAEQIERVHDLFHGNPDRNAAYFWCRYWVGPSVMVVNRECYGNNPAYEWLRVWKVRPGSAFITHEPPKINAPVTPLTHQDTERAGCVFDHMAYATEAQVAFKERYYGRESGLYKDAVKNWRRLQNNEKWPVKLKDFLPWVDDAAIATRRNPPFERVTRENFVA